MKNTEDGMTTKEWIHKLVEAIEDEGDLVTVKWLVQPYAARSLNKKYEEEKNHEANA